VAGRYRDGQRPAQSNTNLHRTPCESTRSAYGSLAAQTEFNRMAIGMTSETVRRKRSGRSCEKNPPAAARNLMPPFPGQRRYGTDPRRQGYPEGELLQKRQNFSLRRAAPLTAPVPFRTTRCTTGKGGESKGTGSRLAPVLMSGRTAASKVRGLRPCDPAWKKSKLSLDRRGPSHGSRDRQGAFGVRQGIEL
jgi:hypothetical protein